MKNRLLRIVIFCSLYLTFLSSCGKGGVSAPAETLPPPPPVVKVDDDTQDYGPYAAYPQGLSKTLNVVYFLPADYKGPLNQYQRRLSKMMLFMQDWFRKEMSSYGFGDKTFGLLRSTKDPNYVKIIVVRGKENRWAYPYNGGGSKAITEINAYYAAHPQEKASEHTLVFMPSITGDGKGNNEGGVPFYGLGKFSFVLDYRYFDVSAFPEKRDTMNTSWIAGTIHELGHGLNLPHCTQRVSDNFISLMHNHMAFESNHAKSHITYADACLLNTCEVFNQGGHPYYKSSPQVDIKALRIHADGEKIYFRAKFAATPKIRSVVIYNDPKTSDGDADYNAVSWGSSAIRQTADGRDSVAIDMAVTDILPEYRQHPFDMRVRFCHEDGTFTVQNYKYVFMGGTQADINEDIFEFNKLSAQGWTVTASSSNGDTPVSGMFDNNSNTIWHSKWQGGVDPLPHTIQIDMGAAQTVKGVAFTARQDRSDGRPNGVKVEVSANGTNWTEVFYGGLKDSPAKQIKSLPTAQTVRYLRIKIESVFAGTIPNPQYTHLAELEVF